MICSEEERLVNMLGTKETAKGGLCSFEISHISVLYGAENAQIGVNLSGILRGEVY